MQIGFVVLVGLACKNAILIVEFAKQLHEEGQPLAQATREACRLRLRPILMTSLAFILGVLPMVLAEGAGAEMRRALGAAVFSGMLGVTVFGIFLTPVFFYVIESLGEMAILANPRVRQIGSAFWGLVIGLTVGLLMHELGWIGWPGVLVVTATVALATFAASTGSIAGCWPNARSSGGNFTSARSRHACVHPSAVRYWPSACLEPAPDVL